MDWFTKAYRTRPLPGRAARRIRPTLEVMEGRALLSTMVANFNGFTGTSGGSIWHYQDNGGWTGPGGIGVASVIDSRDQYGGDELFARLQDNSIWSYTFASGLWRNTGGHADNMTEAANGIHVVSGGALWHYQDNGGWVSYGGAGISSVVESHNRAGQEEVFALNTDATVWDYTPLTGLWRNTGGQLQSLVTSTDGILGLAQGSLWHYQDDGGWNFGGGVGLDSIVDTHNRSGQEEVFARRPDGEIWNYTFATGQWRNTGGRLDNMSANADGISGTNFGTLGYLWHYQDDGGWSNTGGVQVAQVVDTYNPSGQEELFARFNDSTIRSYSFATHTWSGTLGALA